MFDVVNWGVIVNGNAAIRVRVLGPAQICAGEAVLAVGPPQRCVVFAALAADAGRPVPQDTLIERVWGPAPPPRGARRTVQTHIASIRGLLRQGGDADGLVRRPGGYLLDLDADLVDVHRFRRLVAQAARGRQPAAERVGLWRQAVGLWRGEPLAELGGDWVTRTRDGWYIEYREAVLGWAYVEIQVGNPIAVLGPLTELLHRYPVVETLPAMLMRALYAAGRRADALDCYQTTRERLDRELAENPGAELRAVYQAILRHESDLPPPLGALPAGAAVPAQLPADVRGFAGRTGEIAELDAIAANAGNRTAAVVISAIAGTAGVGKTALAVHWAHRVAKRFPDGQLYVNLRGFDPGGVATDPADAVRGFLDALAIPAERIPTDRDAQAALYRTQLAGKRMLIVLDNARDSQQVRPLLPGAPGCLILITSRDRLASLVATTGAYPIALDLLDRDEARDLLTRRLGGRRVAAEPEAVDALITGCARLPLALAIAAARAATNPQLPLVRLAAELTGLVAFADNDPSTDVPAVFSWSYQTLTPPAARLFRLLGLAPGPDISAAAAASLAGAGVRLQLTELIQAHLIVERMPGRYTFHDLLRSYAIDLAHRIDPADQRQAATRRVLDHYLHTAHDADNLLNPVRDRLTLAAAAPGTTPEHLSDYHQALEWYTAEREVLLATVDHAAAAGLDTHTWQLAWVLHEVLDRRGDWHDEAAVQEAAAAAAERLNDPAVRALTARILARAYIRLNRYDDANRLLRYALDQASQARDDISRAHTHHILATLLASTGQYADAIPEAEQARDLYIRAGRTAALANALNSIGWYQTHLGQHNQALASCQKALALYQETGDRSGQAGAWDSLGYIQQQQGRYPDAVGSYQAAIDLYRHLGDHFDQAESLVSLGDLQYEIGDHPAARTAWREALALYDQLQHVDVDLDQLRAKLVR